MLHRACYICCVLLLLDTWLVGVQRAGGVMHAQTRCKDDQLMPAQALQQHSKLGCFAVLEAQHDKPAAQGV